MLTIMERKKGESARDYVTRVLIDNIVNVHLEPGEKLLENDLSGQLGVAAFENGIGDFVALWAPHMYAGTDKGWKVAGSAALCGKGTPLVLVADTKYADAHPEITAKFLSVYLRGVEHLRTTSVDELIPEYQRFFFDWAGKTYSKELARLDLESHPAWDIKGHRHALRPMHARRYGVPVQYI